jgi:hypothetical protein
MRQKGELSSAEYEIAKLEIIDKMNNILKLEKLHNRKENGELSNEEYLILRQSIMRKITGKKEQ